MVMQQHEENVDKAAVLQLDVLTKLIFFKILMK